MTQETTHPKLRFPEFEEEWESQPISNQVVLSPRPIKMENEANYELVTVKRRYAGIESRGILKGEDILVKSQFQLCEGDFLISKRQIVHNACGIVPSDLDGAIVSNEYSVFTASESGYIPFFFYKSLSPRMSQAFYLSSIGVVIEKMLFKVDDWLKRKFLFPKHEEQQKIATFLTSVDQKIEKLQRKKDLLTDYKKGMMQKLFSQQLRFKDDQGNNFPEWEEKKLGEVAEIIGGGTPETSKSDYWGEEINWFTPTEIKTKYLKQSVRKISSLGLQKSSAKKLPIGTLLLSTRATVGDVGIATEECSTNQGFQSLVVSEKNYNEFWYYWILSNKKEFIRKSSGSTFIEISKTEIQKIKTQAPRASEQHKIANYLTALDKKIDLTNKKLTQAQAFKKGLLQQMFV